MRAWGVLMLVVFAELAPWAALAAYWLLLPSQATVAAYMDTGDKS